MERLTRDPRLWHWTFYNVPDLPRGAEYQPRKYFMVLGGMR